jgi:hypothetical protein
MNGGATADGRGLVGGTRGAVSAVIGTRSPARSVARDATASFWQTLSPNGLCIRASVVGLPAMPKILQQAAQGPWSPIGRR